MKEAFAFPSSLGHTLQGYFYHYADPIPGRIVVFDHGFGGGHLAYMKEIEKLCRRGFLVFSYDHTGCMESGGADPRGLSQSLCDLNDCLTALKAHPRAAGLDISVMGHSWGGFSCLNIAPFHPDVSHIVVLSGFISPEKIIGQFFGGILKGYRKCILAMEKENNPRFAGCCATESLAGTNAKVLLIYSDNDKSVRKDIHFDALEKSFRNRENIRLMLVQGKSHNPNYTVDAVRYKDTFFAALTAAAKKKELVTDEQKAAFVASWDWERMTVQDDAVWKEIFLALE